MSEVSVEVLGGAVVPGRVSEGGSDGSEKLIFDESWEADKVA